MSFLTFDHDRSESQENSPPTLRMNLIVHAVSTMQNVVGLEKVEQQTRKEARYGKVQKVSKQLFDNEWTYYRAQKAANAITNPTLPIDQPDYSVHVARNETILDHDITIDQYQFDVMAAEKHAESIKHAAITTPAPDAVELELQRMIDSETSSEADKIIEDSRQKAMVLSTPTSDALRIINQANL